MADNPLLQDGESLGPVVAADNSHLLQPGETLGKTVGEATPVPATVPASIPGGVPGVPMLAADTVPDPKSDTGVSGWLRRNTVGAIQGLYHAATDSATDSEKAAILAKIKKENEGLAPDDPDRVPETLATNPSRATLMLHRLLDAPADELKDKANKEEEVAADLLKNHKYWKGSNLYLSGLVDKGLAAVPVVGPMINATAERAEKGDVVGAGLDALTAGALTGLRTPANSTVADLTEGALNKAAKSVADVGEAALKETAPAAVPENPQSGQPPVKTPKTADTVAAANAAKAPIAAGANAVTDAPTIEDVQPQIQKGLRDTINSVAAKEGLKEVPADTSVRDLGKNLGDQFYARSKEVFAKVKEATGVDLNELHEKISTISDKITDAIGDSEKEAPLEAAKTKLEWMADQAFDDAKAAGIDPEQARVDWKKFNASYDLGKQIRMATDGRTGIGSGEVVDPNKLAPRLQKMADSNSPTQPGRLQQLAGDDLTKNLLTSAESGRGAIANFEPTTATGQKALQNLIRQNTGTGPTAALTGPRTNWIKTFQDFNKMPAEEATAAFGKDADAARQFLRSKARWQIGRRVVGGATLAAVATEFGITKALAHLILE